MESKPLIALRTYSRGELKMEWVRDRRREKRRWKEEEEEEEREGEGVLNVLVHVGVSTVS